jgi:hypothetical protein
VTSFEPDDSSGESLSYSFSFIEPSFQTVVVDNSIYTNINMPGCIAIGKQAGNPMLPVRFIKLLIPPLKTISNIDVVGNPVEIELESIDLKKSPIFPYQNPVSIGSEPEKFIINTALYGSKSVHPSVIYENNLIGYSRGYAILDLAMIPIQYIPGEGRLFYYPEMTVTIHLEETEDMNQFYRNNPEDETWVKNIVWNPEIAERYKTEQHLVTLEVFVTQVMIMTMSLLLRHIMTLITGRQVRNCLTTGRVSWISTRKMMI